MSKTVKGANAQNQKNANASQESKVVNLNLEKFEKSLESVSLKEKKTRETIYNYPEGWGKEKINSEEGKKFRNSLRNQMKRFSNNVFYYAKIKENDKLIAEIDAFNAFYLKNFRINDYSLDSITQSKDDAKSRDLSLMMDIIKEVNASKK